MKQSFEKGEPSPIALSHGEQAPEYEEIQTASTKDTCNISLSGALVAVAAVSEDSEEKAVADRVQIPSPPPCTPAQPQTPLYEEIQVLQATTRNTNSCNRPDLAAAYTFTMCPAYGKVPQYAGAEAVAASAPRPHMSAQEQAHAYEEIEMLQATTRNTSPCSSVPDLVAAYTFTKCPAYGEVHQHTMPEQKL